MSSDTGLGVCLLGCTELLSVSSLEGGEDRSESFLVALVVVDGILLELCQLRGRGTQGPLCSTIGHPGKFGPNNTPDFGSASV